MCDDALLTEDQQMQLDVFLEMVGDPIRWRAWEGCAELSGQIFAWEQRVTYDDQPVLGRANELTATVADPGFRNPLIVTRVADGWWCSCPATIRCSHIVAVLTDLAEAEQGR